MILFTDFSEKGPISSADMELLARDREFPPGQWNIIEFHELDETGISLLKPHIFGCEISHLAIWFDDFSQLNLRMLGVFELTDGADDRKFGNRR